jgi:hypothetical protein
MPPEIRAQYETMAAGGGSVANATRFALAWKKGQDMAAKAADRKRAKLVARLATRFAGTIRATVLATGCSMDEAHLAADAALRQALHATKTGETTTEAADAAATVPSPAPTTDTTPTPEDF